MCVKLPSGDLNLGSCSPHLTSTYTFEMTTALRVHGGICQVLFKRVWNEEKNSPKLPSFHSYIYK